jgi:hypothetical protein
MEIRSASKLRTITKQGPIVKKTMGPCSMTLVNRNKWNSTFILFFSILTLFASCQQERSMIKIDIDKQLAIAAKASLQKDSLIIPFAFCDLLPVKEWDTIIVIGPYSNEESFENIAIKDFDAVKDILLSVTNDEEKCILAYLKNNKVFGYSIIPRSPIDLSIYNRSVYTIKRSSCSSIGLKRSNDHLQIISSTAK